MFFLKIFTRNLSRQSVFSVINITGLSVGLTAVLLICAFIFNEFSFDKSFTHHQRIYRVIHSFNESSSFFGGRSVSVTTGALADAMKEEMPAIEAAVRISVWPVVVKTSDEPFKIENFCWADRDFFRLFDTPFIYGSPDAFMQHGSIAISESQAKVFFGDRNPIDETLTVNNQPMKVNAVYKDFPENSSFEHYQVIGNYMSAPSWITNIDWNDMTPEVFFLLVQGTDVSVVESVIQRLFETNSQIPDIQTHLQPLNKIHLYSKDLSSLITNNLGDIGRVKMFALLAAIILLVACINYMNLSTARAQKRAKEIGISKTLGAKRKGIIMQLFAESGLLTFLSFLFGFLLTFALLPVFNLISGQHIHPGVIFNIRFLLGMLPVYLVTTLIAASYPAFYLSGFAPLTIVRRAVFVKGSSHALVRKGLSVMQFSVAVILITWVIVIRMQMNYANHKDMGYDVQNVVSITLSSQSGLDALRNDYLAQESVSEATFSSGFPSTGRYSGRLLFKTLDDMYNGNQENSHTICMNKISPKAIEMLKLKLIAGTTLPERRPDDTITHIIVNRTTAIYLEKTPEELIGTRLPAQFNEPYIYVSGVVEDFHSQSLHESILPYGLHNSNKQWLGYLLLKVKADNLSQPLRTYEEIFKKHYPNDAFEATFPSAIVEKAYEEDRNTGRLVMSFSFLAILVACMGVFGLTAFMAEQRTKEIGIRKVLGASVGSIVRLFTDNYMRLLALSLVIALPIAWWICNKYLDNFAYSISLVWWMFAAAALITVLLTLLTVGFQAIKASMSNPVESIKND